MELINELYSAVLFQDITFRDTDEAVAKLENDYCLAIILCNVVFSSKNISLTIFFFPCAPFTFLLGSGIPDYYVLQTSLAS